MAIGDIPDQHFPEIQYHLLATYISGDAEHLLRGYTSGEFTLIGWELSGLYPSLFFVNCHGYYNGICLMDAGDHLHVVRDFIRKKYRDTYIDTDIRENCMPDAKRCIDSSEYYERPFTTDHYRQYYGNGPRQ